MSAVTPIRTAKTTNWAGQGTAPGAEAGHAPRRPTTPPLSPGRQATSTPLRPVDDMAEVRAVTRTTVQAAMEVLAGIRPIHQLARRLDPRCLAALQHRAALIRRELTRTGSPALARLHRNSTVRSVRVCEVADGIYEASAVVVDDVRARAVAVRLEQSKQVWRVTELVIG